MVPQAHAAHDAKDSVTFSLMQNVFKHSALAYELVPLV